MSTLSTIQEGVERTIYKAIRSISEEHGYSPVITTYTNDVPGQTNYNLAMNAIVASKEFAIEVFGNSNPQAKGEKKIARIVIINNRVSEGEIGNDIAKNYQINEDDETFSAFILPGKRSNLNINVTLVSNTAKQRRILNAILHTALGNRGYLELLDLSGNFFFEQVGFESETNSIEGIMEDTYAYNIPDIQLAAPIIVNAAVPKLQELTLEFWEGLYMETGELDQDYKLDNTLIIT